MKKLYLFSCKACIALTFLFFTATSFAQEVLYFESFSEGIPEDFRIVDVDGLIVNPSIDSSSIEDMPYNGTWVEQVNFQNPDDMVAASSSWYNPPGISDDWLITGQISIPDTSEYFLQWRAAARDPDFADGYEVYISTTGNAVGDFSNLVFSVDEEVTTWITHKVSLAEFAGQDIFIAFRNNSDDKFLLFVDDIYIADSGATVDVDPAILSSDFVDIYTSATLGQIDSLFLSALFTNLGPSALQDSFGVIAGVFDPFPTDLVFSQVLEGPTAPFASLDVGGFVGEPAFVPSDTGLHIITFLASAIEQDSLPGNEFMAEAFDNDFDFQTLIVSDSVLARDNGVFSTLWDVPGGENQRTIVGSVFNILKADVLTSATFFIFPFSENVGDELFAQVYNDSLQLVAQSDSYSIVGEDTLNVVALNLSFAQGSVNKRAAAIDGVSLEPGAFLLAIQGGATLPLIMTNDIFFPGGTFFSWDSLAQGGGWFTTEELKPLLDSLIIANGGGPGDLFNDQRVAAIRANLAGCGALNAELELTGDDGSGNGSAAVIPSGGQAPYTYAWSDSQPRPETDSLLTGLAAGRYSVTITDNRGCETFLIVVISQATSTQDPVEIGLSNFSAYPNPVVSTLNVDFTLDNPDDVQLSLLDIQGRIVNTQSFDKILSMNHQIPTENWSTGIYLLRVQTSKGILHKRIMVK
ncbi:MAG: choice-of-anchor J domain-containing protein [Bacteroidota bacterium]